MGKVILLQEKDFLKNYTVLGEIKSNQRKPVFEPSVIEEGGFQAKNLTIT